MAVDGIALGCIAVGAGLTYAGIKGKSVPSLIQGFVQGKAPAAASSANPITTTASSSGGRTVLGSAVDAISGTATANMKAIAQYLVQNGYSVNGALGVAVCCWGESTCDPEAVGTGGAGLIGWTPPSKMADYGGTCHAAGIGTESTDTDFSNQLRAIVGYNSANGDVGTLNAQTSITAAADYYSQNFERPAVTDSDVHAAAIAQATAIAVLLRGSVTSGSGYTIGGPGRG